MIMSTPKDANDSRKTSEKHASTSLQDLAGQHSKFLNHLVDLIPANYYGEAREHVSLKHMKKEEREATKQAFKEQYKLNKRQKLNPDAVKTTTEKLREQAGGANKGVADRENDGGSSSGGEEEEEAPRMALHLEGAQASGRAELQDRLQRKIEALRAQRGQGDEPKEKNRGPVAVQKKAGQAGQGDRQQRIQAAKSWRDGAGRAQGGANNSSQKRKGGPEGAAAGAAAAGPAAKKAKPAAQPAPAPLSAPALQFPRIELEDRALAPKFTGQAARAAKGGQHRPRHAAPPAGGDSGEEAGAGAGAPKGAQDRLAAALARARGEKILDDPKLIRRAMKKDQKLKEKSGKVWQQRVKTQEDSKKAQQQKRRDNLKGRKDQKVKKKIEKREKKLMRPGFEGRRQGPINPGK